MRLGDAEDSEPEIVSIQAKTWAEIICWKKEKEIFEDRSQIFCKTVENYDDCNQLIEQYKTGVVCVFIMDPVANPDAQGMMNYVCGGIYALGGVIISVGENSFITKEME